MNWVIENIVKEPSFLELSEAVTRANHPLFSINGDFAFSMLEPFFGSPVIFNGSIEMCKLANQVLKPTGAHPILYCTWEHYKCSKWYGQMGEFLFNDDYVMVPLREVKRRLWWFYERFAKEATIFIRPDTGDKSFKGGALDLQDAPRFFDQFESEQNELVVVSSPKNIRGEWRFVIGAEEHKIIAQSSYRYQGLRTLVPSAPRGATELCKAILKQGYHPDLVYCIDICEDGDGNFWLLELTSFSSAGLYATNKDDIVREVSRIAQNDFSAKLS